MTATIAFFSYPRLTEYIKGLKIEMPQNVQVRIFELALDKAVQKALEIERKGEADVFLASGGNANLLRNKMKSPFVEIKVTGFDLLTSLSHIAKQSHKVAIISCIRGLPQLNVIREILTLDIKEFIYNDPAEIDCILQELASSNENDILGGSLAVEKAEAAGFRGHIIYSYEGIYQAFTTASEIAIHGRKFKEQTKSMQALLDFANCGIMSVNSNGYITSFNNHAERITKKSRERVLGKHISSIMPSTKFPTVINTGQPVMDELERIGMTDLLINWAPVIVSNEIIGAVGTFQAVNIIQASEKKLRVNLHQKGLIAKTFLSDIVGDSPAVKKAKRQAELFAESDSTILILGATGTGKELFAQGIHNASRRSQGPFMALNCAALPQNLLESELFGYAEGAFTGAKKDGKQGLFELAHGGTIFLDEIGEAPLAVQPRLLRVLEQKEIFRIGDDKVIPVDVRIIAATNKDLRELVKEGKFREDLYYRICILILHLPNLMQRKQDIIPLMRYFLLCENLSLPEHIFQGITTHNHFLEYNWPGNIRELKSFVKRLGTLVKISKDIDELLSLALPMNGNEVGRKKELAETIEAINRCGGNKTQAASELGISRSTLWRRIKQLDRIDPLILDNKLKF